MGNFISFYTEMWQAQKFFFFVGYTSNDRREAIVEQIFATNPTGYTVRDANVEIFNAEVMDNVQLYLSNESDGESGSIDFITYKTNLKTTYDDFNLIKRSMFRLADKYLPRRYNRVLAVDEDEYLYVTDLETVKKESRFFTHYVDHVPHEGPFDPEKGFRWCVNPWYYVWPFESKDKLTHECKDFRLKRKYLRSCSPWNHAGTSSRSCACGEMEMLLREGREDEILKLIAKRGIGFHFAAPDIRYLNETRKRSGFAEMGNHCQTDDAKYLSPQWHVFRCDLLKPFFVSSKGSGLGMTTEKTAITGNDPR